LAFPAASAPVFSPWLAHAQGPFGHADENRGRAWDESFDIAQGDRKGRDLAAHFFQGLYRRTLTPLQEARREHGQMSGQVGQFGMQLAAEAFDKFPNRVSYVGHQGVTRGQHDPVVNYTP
jgi:hypothetical protein